MLYFWNPADSSIPKNMIDTSPWWPGPGHPVHAGHPGHPGHPVPVIQTVLEGRVYHCFGFFEGEQGLSTLLCHTHIFRNSCTDLFVLNYLNHKPFSSFFSWTSFSLSVDFLRKRDRLAICGPSAFGRHFLQFSHFQQQRRHLDLNFCCIVVFLGMPLFEMCCSIGALPEKGGGGKGLPGMFGSWSTFPHICLCPGV